MHTAIDPNSKLILDIEVYGRRGTDPAAAFLHRLTEKTRSLRYRVDDWLLLRTYHDSWKDLEAVELYNLDDDPYEVKNVADEHPEVADHGMALLEKWRSQRGIDAATGTNGGNPDAPRALIDPMYEVIRDGGSFYLRGNKESYTKRLRETGREEHADYIEEHDGIVSQDASDYV